MEILIRVIKILIFSFLGVMTCQAQTYQWAKNIGGAGSCSGNSIAVDGTGNVYTLGKFDGVNDFDPGAGTVNFTGSGSLYVSKLTSTGAYSWARIFTGTGSNAWGQSITLDAGGNVYITGAFSGTVDFDPGTGVLNLTAAGEYDVFVCKINSTGALVWAKRFGGAVADWGMSIVTDATGNVYISGIFEGTVDFDPGTGVFNMTAPGTVYDIFVNKLTSAGIFVWARKMGGAGSDQAYCSALDATGNIYVSGYFEGTADFDPGGAAFNMTSAGNSDIFIVKLSSAGAFGWAKRMGGAEYEQSYSMAIDATGNIHTSGYFMGTVDFDPGTGVANLVASGTTQDIFISKLNSSGNYVWAKKISGNGIDVSYGIDLDASGNVYTTGYYSSTTDFNPGTATANFTASGADFFINKLNSSGNYQWNLSQGGTGFDRSNAITVDAAGNIYTTGFFNATVDFNAGSGTANLTSTSSDAFVYKLSQPSPLPVDLLSFDALPTETAINIIWQTASEINNDYFTVERSLDGNLFEEIGRVEGAGNSAALISYFFTDNNPYVGISYYRLKQTDFDASVFYSKTIVINFSRLKKDVSVFCNTLEKNCHIQFNATVPSICQLYIFDLTGRVVTSELFNINRGFNDIQVDAAKFAPGVYFLQMQKDGEENISTKFIVK